MDKSFKKRIPPPGGGWDAFILFWTAVVAAVMRLQKNGGLGGSRKNKFYCFDSLSLTFYSKS